MDQHLKIASSKSVPNWHCCVFFFLGLEKDWEGTRCSVVQFLESKFYSVSFNILFMKSQLLILSIPLYVKRERGLLLDDWCIDGFDWMCSFRQVEVSDTLENVEVTGVMEAAERKGILNILQADHTIRETEKVMGTS